MSKQRIYLKGCIVSLKPVPATYLTVFTPGLALPRGPCAAGFYCVGGAIKAKPTDGVTGSVCPPGTYCGEGLRWGPLNINYRLCYCMVTFIVSRKHTARGKNWFGSR